MTTSPGTFTFVRAIEDSGRYLDVGYEDFGKNWLNYIIENKSILWWGGMGLSTEHTAYLRLKEGHRPPETGSMAHNGKVVAEQIGAQIFIDAFGLVTPGRPDLAVKLAEQSSRVSHDGEAVWCDGRGGDGLGRVRRKEHGSPARHRGRVHPGGQPHRAGPPRREGSGPNAMATGRPPTIASPKNGATRSTAATVHIIPNHALMVMAWAYAPDDFRKAQAIVNTAGWDTDCNAANVGTVMGIKVGLDDINRDYDFQSMFADRIILPTAEGTRGITDCLAEALYIAQDGPQGDGSLRDRSSQRGSDPPLHPARCEARIRSREIGRQGIGRCRAPELR